MCLIRISYFWIGDLAEKEAWLGNFSKAVPGALMIKRLAYIGPLPFLILGLLIAWRQRRSIALPMLLFLTFPFVYYMTHVWVKYRYYIDPLILVFASYGFCTMVELMVGSAKQKLNVPASARLGMKDER